MKLGEKTLWGLRVREAARKFGSIVALSEERSASLRPQWGSFSAGRRRRGRRDAIIEVKWERREVTGLGPDSEHDCDVLYPTTEASCHAAIVR